jgi:ribosomal protein S6--L-glutamate ligase
MNIAIISSLSSPNTKDLLDACERRSIGAKAYRLKDLVIDTEALDSSDFMAHDAYIFRGYNKSYEQALSLAQYLAAQGKIVIDQQLTGGFVPSKFHEALTYRANAIPHPRTVSVRDSRSDLIESIELPVIIKDTDSQKGKGVRLCQSRDELRNEITQHGDSIIIQRFVPMQYDIRVLCVGSEVIGAIRRDVIDGDFRSNVSLGSVARVYDLNEEVSTLALRAHTAMKYDVSGVDIGFGTDGTPFVIETNITPEWQGFKAATGIDVADRIVQHVIERFEHER